MWPPPATTRTTPTPWWWRPPTRDEGDRNAAALRFESGLHTPGQGVIWTLGLLTVRVSGDRDPAAVDALTEALDDRGAK